MKCWKCGAEQRQVTDIGYKTVLTGPVLIGDRIWSPSSNRWLDVTDQTLRDLQFLDAAIAEELICVIRKVPE